MTNKDRVIDGKAPDAAFGTKEWAATNVNIQIGCEHGCLYCYGQCMSVRFGRTTGNTWTTPVINRGKVAEGYRKRRGTIMFPTTHDITQANLEPCLTVLKKMLAAGNEVLVVSKPHLVCVNRLCQELEAYKDQILFRFTIGSAAAAVLSFWEPHAPAYPERLASLREAFQRGYKTSVSCEPMLDGSIQRVIDDARPYVTDAIWLGRVNNIRGTLVRNAPYNQVARAKADELLALQTDDWVREMYETHKHDPLIKFKDSFKAVVGLDRPTEKGLDI